MHNTMTKSRRGGRHRLFRFVPLMHAMCFWSSIGKCQCLMPSQMTTSRSTNYLHLKRTSLQEQQQEQPQPLQDAEFENDNDDENDAKKNIDVDHIDVDMISDAEALLACRAFLQRKNRIGWEQAKERKELRKAQESSFLWDKPEKRKRRQLLDEHDDDYDYYFDIDETNTHGSVSGKMHLSSSDASDTAASTGFVYYNEIQDEEDEYNNNDDRVDSIFTEMPTGPNQRSQIRSRVKKEQWNDPTFRERWYEARWGHHTKRSIVAEKQKQMQSKLRRIPLTILQSPEFTKMTPDEIEQAITSYVVANRKRSRAQNEHHIMNSQPLQQEQLEKDYGPKDAEPLARDSLYTISEETLRERQRQRAEKAAAAYQKRVVNAKQKSVTAKATTTQKKKLGATTTTTLTTGSTITTTTALFQWKPDGNSPKDALIRIVVDLDANRMPSLQDVQLMMEASKLSRRKDILRRILSEQFDVRGKVIPSSKNGTSTKKKKNDDHENDDEVSQNTIYVTQASISQLGKFVIDLMQSQK